MIDDEQTIRLLVAEALFEAGYAVDVAANGAEALERMRLAIPDAVILDVMMPRLDGYGFVEQVRRDQAFDAVPIVVVTAAYSGLLIAEQLGAQECLTKPFELDALLAAVDRAVSPSAATV